MPWISDACLARCCSGNRNKLLSLRNTLIIVGQPDKWHKQKFKTVFSKLCLHCIRSLFCSTVVLMILTGKVKVQWLLDFRGSYYVSGGQTRQGAEENTFFFLLLQTKQNIKFRRSSISSSIIIIWVCQHERLLKGICKIWIPNYYPIWADGWDKSAKFSSLSF